MSADIDKPQDPLDPLRRLYFQAWRSWKCYNTKKCLALCDQLARNLTKTLNQDSGVQSSSPRVAELKHLIWFLKIRCLSEDYYVNESLLLNDDDEVEDDDQVRVVSSSSLASRGAAGQPKQTEPSHASGAKPSNKSSLDRAQQLTEIASRRQTQHRAKSTMGAHGGRLTGGALTGRLASVASSKQSSRATSYRPLTTSMTALQTAFSRSTRPLLKFASNKLLAKPLFEYLYNAQSVTNKCPDYRQCLEYLNLVHKSHRELGAERDTQADDDRRLLSAFWLLAYGTAYFHLKMNQQAEESFRLALHKDPKRVDSYAWLVKIYLRTNQPVQVLSVCQSGLEHCESALLYNWLSRVQSMMGDLYLARANLRKSLRCDPTNVEALANAGYYAFYSDQAEQALRCFERIQQISSNQVADTKAYGAVGGVYGSSAGLLNNLAICNFYCGFHDQVVPLFMSAILKSPSKLTTSDIWFNMSFVPLNCGLVDLAVGCLNLALKNNSQNEEAMNNLGVLRYNSLVNSGHVYVPNKQELVAVESHSTTAKQASHELANLDDLSKHDSMYDEAESYFSQSPLASLVDTDETIPERLYNMAVLKQKRGQLVESMAYANLYLCHDANNYQIKRMMRDIRTLVLGCDK